MAVLFVLIFFAAIIGVFKPYLGGLKRSHFALIAGASFILVGVFASKDEASAPNKVAAADSENSPTTASTTSADAAGTEATTSADEPKSKWQYSTDKDEMRGTTTRFASIKSENEVDLGFPYGRVRGTLWVRQRPEDGLNVMFSVDSGQILCRSYSDSYVSIKFDDQPIRKYRCTSASDGSSDTAFLSSERAVLSKLKTAKRTIVEAEFFQNGRKQFTFDTEGLDWK